MPEPTRNPYDRRNPPRRGHMEQGFASVAGRPSMAGELVGPSAIALEDLQALVWSARQRATVEERERADRERWEGEHAARREAWTEGHDLGQYDGRSALLKQINDLHGNEANAMLTQLIAAVESGSNLTKAQLLEHVTGARNLLDKLVASHHEGFGPVPR